MAPPPNAVIKASNQTPNKSYFSSIATIAPLIAKATVPMIFNKSQDMRTFHLSTKKFQYLLYSLFSFRKALIFCHRFDRLRVTFLGKVTYTEQEAR